MDDIDLEALEDLAAFIDGRLGDEDRRRVLARLDSDQAYYEVFVETVHLQAEEKGGAGAGTNAGDAPPSNVVAYPAGRLRAGNAFWLATAALLALAVAWWLFDRLDATLPTADRLLATVLKDGGIENEGLEAHLGEDWSNHGWPVTRGEAAPLVGADAATFQAGARLVDLQLALAAGEDEAVEPLLYSLRGALEAIDEDGFLTFYVEPTLTKLDESGAMPSSIELLELEELLAEHLGQLDTTGRGRLLFDLGKWTAAGHYSALAGARGYFHRGTSGRFLRRLELARVGSEGLENRLARVRELAASGPREEDMAELSEAMAEALELGGGGGLY